MPNIEELQKKANNGKVDACLELMQYYAEGSNGLPQDLDEAKRWGKRAISSWYRMSWQRIDRNDYEEILRKASNGDVNCCLQMASFYGTGTNQLAQNAASAREWLEDAIVIYARNAANNYDEEEDNEPEDNEEYYSEGETDDEGYEDTDGGSDDEPFNFDKGEFLNQWFKSAINFES